MQVNRMDYNSIYYAWRCIYFYLLILFYFQNFKYLDILSYKLDRKSTSCLMGLSKMDNFCDI